MIVRPAEDATVLLITQPAHASLARTVMEQCVPLVNHPRRAAILHAIAAHDDGWKEEDAAPEFDAAFGAVIDFIHIPVAARQRVWPRSVRALADDPWAAALVAHHAITVYDTYRPDGEWTPFFHQMEVLREEMLQKGDVARNHLAADYVYLRLGDLISLCFCTASPAEQRVGEWRVQGTDPSVLVSPDPFGGREIQMEISAQKVQPGTLRSSADLRERFDRLEQVTVRGTAHGRLNGALRFNDLP